MDAVTEPVCNRRESRLKAERYVASRARVGVSVPTGNVLWICLTCFVIDFFKTRDLIGLRTFCPLNDVELDLIALFEALVALALDRAVMNEDVRPAVAAEEAIALCVVEPLHSAFVLCQWSDSLTVRI